LVTVGRVSVKTFSPRDRFEIARRRMKWGPGGRIDEGFGRSTVATWLVEGRVANWTLRVGNERGWAVDSLRADSC